MPRKKKTTVESEAPAVETEQPDISKAKTKKTPEKTKNRTSAPKRKPPERGFYDPKPGVKQARKESLIYWLSQWPEGELPPRSRWNEAMPKDPPPPGWTKAQLETKSFSGGLYQKFTPAELDDIQTQAINKKIKNMGSKAVNVLEKLYENALNGDTASAKEFLNRVIGPVNQQIDHKVGPDNDLKSLLGRFRASDAAAKPEIDSEGFEIIEGDMPEELEGDIEDELPEEDSAQDRRGQGEGDEEEAGPEEGPVEDDVPDEKTDIVIRTEEGSGTSPEGEEHS